MNDPLWLRMMIVPLWLRMMIVPLGGMVCDNQKCHGATVRCRWLWVEMHKLNVVWVRQWACLVVIMHGDYYIIKECPMIGRIILSTIPYNNTFVVLVSHCSLSILAPPLVITIISVVFLPFLSRRTLHCRREIEVILCTHLHSAFSCWRDVVV